MDNYVGERVPGKGKVYKPSEKEQFKFDLLNAYVNELQKRGMDSDTALAYGKRIVAQDALESKYGHLGYEKWNIHDPKLTERGIEQTNNIKKKIKWK